MYWVIFSAQLCLMAHRCNVSAEKREVVVVVEVRERVAEITGRRVRAVEGTSGV